MPDLETPPTNDRPPVPRDDDGSDPLAHLHKMSTTAGLGSTDYVAINTPAILAVILGLASALAVVDKILLIVPIAGVICAIVALYQIGKSAGTQTGRGLAILGLLLSLGFAAYVGYLTLDRMRTEKADRAAIEAIIAQFSGHVKQGEFKQAYALFSPRFHERVLEPEFSDRLKYVQAGSWGKLETITTNDRYSFDSDPTTGVRVGQTILQLKADQAPEPMRLEAIFRLVGGEWKFENIPAIFPAPQQGQAG